MFFFFNEPAPTEIYTLSLHDALPISAAREPRQQPGAGGRRRAHQADQPRSRLLARRAARAAPGQDRKSTRLNSSHQIISYAVFCLKKKTQDRVLTDSY